MVEDVRLQLAHIEVAAQVYGPPDGAPVLALHGWLDNAATFSRLAPKLAGLRIVALDFPGHGLSAHRPVGAEYSIWSYTYDVLAVADALGWSRFSLMGHSMGAITAVLLAGAVPERVERLALIDGLLPYTAEAAEAPEKLGQALKARMALAAKRKPIYAERDRALAARQQAMGGISPDAAQCLAERGLMTVEDGYTWRTDSALTLPSGVRLTLAQAQAFAEAITCPVALVLAEKGLLAVQPQLLPWVERLPFTVHQLPGGHHLHLDDEAGATRVADCFKALFGLP